MSRPVLVIHGGTTFSSREEYLTYLRRKEIELSDLIHHDWKTSLGEVLGEDYVVHTPRMPNAQDARYGEWKVWFEKILSLLDDGVILIGHSLGGIFLVKYLAENEPIRKIKATYLIAPPYFEVDGERYEGEEYIGDFALPNDLTRVVKQSGPITLYFSRDDLVVPVIHAERYQRSLPAATIRHFLDRGHFLQEEFPELVEDVKNS